MALSIAATLVLAGACSGPDASVATTTTTTTAARATTTQGSPCPEASRLKVTQVDQVTEVDAVNSFAQLSEDGGKGTILLSITDAPIDRTTAFLEGEPTVASGQALVRVRASNAAGAVVVGAYRGFSNTTGDGKLVETTAVYTGDGRLLPTEEHHLVITEITPDHVCGRIEHDDDDATYFDATFIATRVDS